VSTESEFYQDWVIVMKKTLSNKEIREHLDRLTHEINQLKANLIYQDQPENSNSDGIWKALMKDSEEIAKHWSGYSAIDEIRDQRGS
jgi:hypothetical protein